MLGNGKSKKMKRTIALLSLLLLIIVTGCRNTSRTETTLTPVSTPESIDIAAGRDSGKIILVTGEYPPYTSESMPGGGFYTQMVQSTFDTMGIECEIKFYPWGRCAELVQSGQAWATFPYGYSSVHARDYLLSDGLYPAIHRYFYLKKNTDLYEKVKNYHNLPEFKNYVFGGANGYWYGNKKDMEANGVKAEWTADTNGLVQMLYHERIDFFMEDEIVGWNTIKKEYPGQSDKFAVLRNPAHEHEYLLLVSKVYPGADSLLKKFNMAAEQNKKNGTYEKILIANNVKNIYVQTKE